MRKPTAAAIAISATATPTPTPAPIAVALLDDALLLLLADATAVPDWLEPDVLGEVEVDVVRAVEDVDADVDVARVVEEAVADVVVAAFAAAAMLKYPDWPET
jgi:type VI protein secretion system component VasF